MQLTKGQNTAITAETLQVRVTARDTISSQQVYVVLLGADGRPNSPDDLVHPGAPSHPSGAATLEGETLTLELPRVAMEVDRIVLLAARTGAPLAPLELTAAPPHGTPFADFAMPASSGETAMICCEIYRRAGGWKLRAVGQGYAEGLRSAANDFGFTVPADSGSAVSSAPRSVTPGHHAPSAAGPAARPSAPVSPSSAETYAPTGSPAHAGTVAAAGSPAPTTRSIPLIPAVPQVNPAQTTDRAPDTGDGVAVLARRTEFAAALDEHRSAAAAALARLLTRIGARTAEAMPATASAESQIGRSRDISRTSLGNAYDAIRDAMITKYRLSPSWCAYDPTRTSMVEADPAEWLAGAESALRAIYNVGFQLTRLRRMEEQTRLTNLAQRSFGDFPAALRGVDKIAEDALGKLYAETFSAFVDRVPDQVMQAVTHFRAVELPDLARTPDAALPSWQITAPEAIAPSVARLLCPIGVLRPDRAVVETELIVPSPPGGRHPHRFTFPLDGTAPEIPVLLDLDRCGGIVTDDAAVVENLTLDLLAALPAGRLVIDVVDPAKVGASLNFLYGLGEAGEKIYGQKVWSAHNVGELLTELENHVAFVTQKYLQGTHETLTDYNRAAGEVAEPYRLLLLFDHPQALTRDGRSYDDESFARLERLATVGRRAGVLIAATVQDRNARALGALATAYTADEDTALVTGLGLPRTVATIRYIRSNQLEWRLRAYPRPSDPTRAAVLAHIERTLAHAADTRVDPGRVAELAARAAQREAAKGHGVVEPIAGPHDAATWWHGAVEDRIVARFGRMGAADVAQLRLDSRDSASALIGGRTGSGKSVLLHSIILGFAMQYSPRDLEFYLIDFKEGVEFKPYATGALPHAKVVAIETNRDFGISVLESLDSEIARRGALFKNAVGGHGEIGRYRAETGQRLPRIVLVIDEFHMLLEQDDGTATRGAELLDRIIRQGRAFGVHTILASQSIAGGGQKIRTALNQIKVRLVLASSTQDSEMLLAEGNSEAKLLSKPGEGIINTNSGLLEANNRFQCSYWSAEARTDVIEGLRKLADQQGQHGKPVVFEGDVPVAPQDFPLELFGRSEPAGVLRLPIGAPMSLAPPLSLQLERQPGNNLLLVAPSALGALALHIAALRRAGIRVDYLDFAAIDTKYEAVYARLCAAGAQPYHRRKFGDVLDALRAEITERAELDDYAAPARVLVLIGIHRARELSADSYDPESESGRLADVLRRGPEVGIHTIAWGDRYVSLERRFDHEGFRQFGYKVLGPAAENDSRALIDSEVAATLTANQFAVDDYDNARTVVVRRFDDPTGAWLDTLLDGGAPHHG